jgi:hypothetical protein
MSFILDALSRAQALRSLKTATLAQPTMSSPAWAARRRFAWPIAAPAAALVALVVVMSADRLWHVRVVTPPGAGAAPGASHPASIVVAGSIPAMGALPGKQPVARTVPQFAAPTALSQPLPVPSRATGRAVGVPPLMALPVPTPVAARELSDVRPLSDLPQELRARISRLKVTVYLYAPQRGHRFVMIDDRQLREGDEVFAGLRLDEIMEEGMVLQYNGLRVLAPYRAS